MPIITNKYTDGSSSKLMDKAFGAATTGQGMIPAPMSTLGSFMVIVDSPTVFTAVVTIWASNRPNPDPAVDTDWVDISAAISDIPTIATEGSSINYMIQIPQLEGGALYYRLKIISSNGSADVAVCGTFKKVK